MRLFAENDNTSSGGVGQESSVRVSPKLHSLHISVDLSWPLVHSLNFLVDLLGQVTNDVSEAVIDQQREAIERQDNQERFADYRRQQQAEILKLARTCASRVRKLQRKGKKRRAAINEVASQFEKSANDLETLLAVINKKVSERRERKRNYLLLKWKAQSVPIKEIAERLNVTPQHVHRLLKQAQSGLKEASTC